MYNRNIIILMILSMLILSCGQKVLESEFWDNLNREYTHSDNMYSAVSVNPNNDYEIVYVKKEQLNTGSIKKSIIYKNLLNGTTRKLVTGSIGSVPKWNGKEEVIFNWGVTGEQEIYLINKDGTNLRKALNSSSYTRRNPDITYEGQKIAYRIENDSNGFKALEVYFRNKDTISSIFYSVRTFEFSPNGNKLAFIGSSKDGFKHKIYYYDLNENKVHLVKTINSWPQNELGWKNEQEVIYITENSDQQEVLLKLVNIYTKESRKLFVCKFNDVVTDISIPRGKSDWYFASLLHSKYKKFGLERESGGIIVSMDFEGNVLKQILPKK